MRLTEAPALPLPLPLPLPLTLTLNLTLSLSLSLTLTPSLSRWDSPRHSGGVPSQLKQRCLDFIMDNYSAVVAAPTFEELTTSSQLMLEISRAAARLVPPGSGSGGGGGAPLSAGAPASKRQRRLS